MYEAGGNRCGHPEDLERFWRSIRYIIMMRSIRWMTASGSVSAETGGRDVGKAVIIGGGAAGMYAAIAARITDARCIFMKKMKSWGKAVYHREGKMQSDQQLRQGHAFSQCVRE